MKAISILLLSICVASPALAWWEAPHPPAVLETRSLNLRVTREGKPRTGSKFELHNAITFDLEEARRTGAFDKRSVMTAVTDSLGLLSFGEVKPGRYWIVPAGGSLGSSVAVETRVPNANPVPVRLWLEYNGEGDLTDSVEAVGSDHVHDSGTNLNAQTH